MSNFKISPRLTATFRDRTATFRWGGGDIDYAAKVHSGRPWTTVGLQSFPVVETVSKAFATDQELDTAFDQSMVQLGDRFVEVIDNHDWGRDGKGRKRHRNGRGPTYRNISDSRALAKSQQLILG